MMSLLKNEKSASEGIPYFAVTVRVTAGLSLVQPVDWMVTMVEPVEGAVIVRL